MGATVVGGGDGSETLLAGSIPLWLSEVVSALSPWAWVGWKGARLTICSFTVLPSSSIVLIFCFGHQQPHFGQVSTRQSGRSAYEVNTNCGDVGLGVGVVGETQEQAGLSNTGITDEEELEEVIVSVAWSTGCLDRFREGGGSEMG